MFLFKPRFLAPLEKLKTLVTVNTNFYVPTAWSSLPPASCEPGTSGAAVHTPHPSSHHSDSYMIGSTSWRVNFKYLSMTCKPSICFCQVTFWESSLSTCPLPSDATPSLLSHTVCDAIFTVPQQTMMSSFLSITDTLPSLWRPVSPKKPAHPRKILMSPQAHFVDLFPWFHGSHHSCQIYVLQSPIAARQKLQELWVFMKQIP